MLIWTDKKNKLQGALVFIKKISLAFCMIGLGNATLVEGNAPSNKKNAIKQKHEKKKQELRIGIISLGEKGGHYTVTCAVKDALENENIRSEIIDPFDEKLAKNSYRLFETKQGIAILRTKFRILRFLADKMYFLSSMYNNYFLGAGKKIYSTICLKKNWLAIVENYDLLISTSPFIHNIIANERTIKQKQLPIIAIPTDQRDFCKGLFIYNPDVFYMVYTKNHLESLKRHSCIRFKEISSLPLRKEFWDIRKVSKEVAKKKLGFDPKEPVVLVSFGSAGNEEVREIARLLENKQCILMCAKNEKLRREMLFLGNPKHRIEGFIDAEAMAKRMRAADVIIGKPGGASVSEAIQCESVFIFLKELIYPVEEGNIEFLLKKHLGKEARKARDVPQIVDQILAEPARSRYKRSLALMRNNGAQEMVSTVHLIMPSI